MVKDNMKIVYDVNSLRSGPIVPNPEIHKHIVFDVTMAEMCKGANPALMLSKNFSNWKGHINALVPCKSIGELYELERASGQAVSFSDLPRSELLEDFREFITDIIENPNAATTEQLQIIAQSVHEQFDAGNEVYLKNDHEIYLEALQKYDLVRKFKSASNQRDFIIDVAVKGANQYLNQYYSSKNLGKNKIKNLNGSCTFHFINHCSFTIRSLMWVRDGGFLNMKDHKVINETADADWCSMAVYGTAVATKDKRNIENIEFLRECIQRKSRKLKEITIL